MTAFELAVQDTHGLAVAARLGVDRIELCSALPLGGLTPSLAFIEAAVASLAVPPATAGLAPPGGAAVAAPGEIAGASRGLGSGGAAAGVPPVHVLVRPRPGGFDYGPEETALIVRDVRHALAAGAAGVVIGGVRAGEVDTGLVGRVIDAAGGKPVTFHRAFDTVREPDAAIEVLADLGVRRILTSGGAAAAGDALPRLARFVEIAGGRIEIMAGGGVRPEVVADLVRAGVAAVHASGKGFVADAVGVTLGSAALGGQSGRETTDEMEVGRLLTALRSVHDHGGRDGAAVAG